MPVIPAMPPPMTKPATAAPISTCFWWRWIWPRQSLATVSSPRRRPSEWASSWRLASIEAADLLRRAGGGGHQ